MVSEKEIKYAYNLINNSLKLQKGERIWIDATDIPEDFVCEILRQVHKVGGFPFLNASTQRINRQVFECYDDNNFVNLKTELDLQKMKNMDCYLSITAPMNSWSLLSLDAKKLHNYKTIYAQNVHFKQRVNHTRWLICNYPSLSLASSAKMSYDEYADYLLDVGCIDYGKMAKTLIPLKKLMESTDKVHILSKGTDLTFSIKGMSAVICAGANNIPDGEVYTAPILNSVEGVISYNAKSVYDGKEFSDVKFEFSEGKIVKAHCNDNDAIEQILNTDGGARFIGEFAIGVNPKIHHPVGDILFDEKIAGSLHFTPGNAYADANNGNVSAVHWDLVLIQTEQYGGGEIWFDNVLVRKNGKFVLDELKPIDAL